VTGRTGHGDLLVRGGRVVDGTGAPARPSDVRVRAGEIVEVGPGLAPDGEPELDAAGAVVAPGFVDVHTHLDPSLWWDPSADPVPLHGVTTVVIGNCSLSLAPAAPEHRATLADMFSFIEDLPREAFETDIPWAWTTWAEYADAFDALGGAVHVAGLVGHSALRLAVIGEESFERPSTAAERAAIADLLAACLRAGALGLSTSFADVDARGRPVPSRAADDDELRALAAALTAGGRPVVEFVPQLHTLEAKQRDIERIHRCFGPAGVRGTWTQLGVGGRNAHHTAPLLEQAERTQREGPGVFPQVSPRPFDVVVNLARTPVFLNLGAWHDLAQADAATKRRLLVDDAWRARAREVWDSPVWSLFPRTHLHKAIVGDETLADLVARRGGHPSDVLADIVVEHDLEPPLRIEALANDDPAALAELLRSPAVVVGGSDAGAHLMMMCGAGDTTLLLDRHVRQRHDLTVEEAVRLLTAVPARRFGITDRGELAPGQAGDLVVFDPDEIRYERDDVVRDGPAGSPRLRRPWGGFRATVAAGVPTQVDGTSTGARPGATLR
jgi:N-acyl-D-aspartate/D-glutamate deacylase